MSAMRMTVYRVDPVTLEHGPVLREVVVDNDHDSRSVADPTCFPPCTCPTCTTGPRTTA